MKIRGEEVHSSVKKTGEAFLAWGSGERGGKDLENASRETGRRAFEQGGKELLQGWGES